jgi:heptosyltransferase I
MPEVLAGSKFSARFVHCLILSIVTALTPRMNAATGLSTRRVCLVLLSGIGDVVHGLPLVNALKRDDPERRITWIAERTPSALLEPHPSVDEVIHFDRRRGLRDVLRLRRVLRDREFDVVLDAGIYFKTAIPTFLARAPHKVGYGPDRAGDLVWLLHGHPLPPRGPRHRQEMYLELVEYLGIDPHPLEWRIRITDEEREAQRRFFHELCSDRVAGMVTTSAMPPKDWRIALFAQLAARLEHELGFRVVLLGGPGAREAERARGVAAETDVDVVWALGPDLRRLVYLIDGCDLLIAPDTGPLHIARALETPVIGLYGHTDPRRAGPYGRYEELVVDRYNLDAEGVPYSGAVGREHPARAGGRGSARMELIEVDDVMRKVELAMASHVRPGAKDAGVGEGER